MGKAKGTCTIDGCERPSDARGWCSTHYSKWFRYGDPQGGGTDKGAPKGSIWAYIRDVVLPFAGDDCLVWPFYRSKSGYGWAHIEGHPRPVSRYVCAKVYGEPPTQKHQAAHSCGKGHEGCVNPRHLSWKTRKENEADKIGHGTRRFGESHPQAKLTTEKVIEIRALRKTHTAQSLADMFQVSKGSIDDICVGKNWAHVGPSEGSA